jgi:hypothetical protein
MLQKVNFRPGFNKQVTATGAEAQWTGGDYVRFRYGTPEKIGGWDQLGGDNLTGAGRALHQFDDNAGIKYAAIGTNRILYLYSGGQYYDIHPIDKTIAGCDFSTTMGEPAVTITFPTPHGMEEDDIVYLDTVTALTGSSFATSKFQDQKFMATSIPTATSITVTMDANETTGSTSNVGSAQALTYYTVGPAQELGGFGFGTGQWSGTASGPATTTLATTIAADAGVTSVTLTSSTAFPSSGTIRIGTEDITYTANDIATGIISGGARAADGTTLALHTAGATITNISDYVGWGQSSTEEVTLEPGMWVLDNYGTTLIALIYNGKCFSWDSSIANPTANRATVVAGAPTASRHMLVSSVDRHLIFFGTETTIGDPTTQDDMFIRFSDQESTSDYTPTATNTAGTQRIANGSKIMGAIRGRDALYVWTDNAVYLMRFVGQPFTFSFEQVGTNCGLIGKNACVEVDGTAFWMSENGFFQYAGQLQTMPCLVEDYVYDDLNSTSRNLINCGLNNLFGEISWYYCTAGSNVVDRVVTYNYLETMLAKSPVWYTGSLARTAWADSSLYDKPHACYYDNADDASFDVTGNTDGVTTYYEQETGTDQINAGGAVTSVLGEITSGDFDITQKRSAQGQMIGAPDLRGDGEYLMKIRRFIPDFITQTGNTQITLMLRNYPNNAAASSALGPFTITSSTDKVDTRARARAVALKIQNTAASQDWKLGTFRLDIQPDGRR